MEKQVTLDGPSRQALRVRIDKRRFGAFQERLDVIYDNAQS